MYLSVKEFRASTLRELERSIKNLRSALRQGERARILVEVPDLISKAVQISMRHGLSVINAEETSGGGIVIEVELRFTDKLPKHMY